MVGSSREDEDVGLEESLGELRERVRASTRGDESCGEEEAAAAGEPKMMRSLNSDGVKGTGTSSCSGKGQRVVKDGSFLLGLDV